MYFGHFFNFFPFPQLPPDPLYPVNFLFFPNPFPKVETKQNFKKRKSKRTTNKAKIIKPNQTKKPICVSLLVSSLAFRMHFKQSMWEEMCSE